MNFFFLLLSAFFSTITPSNSTDLGNGDAKKSKIESAQKERGGNADFIISQDGNP